MQSMFRLPWSTESSDDFEIEHPEHLDDLLESDPTAPVLGVPEAMAPPRVPPSTKGKQRAREAAAHNAASSKDIAVLTDEVGSTSTKDTTTSTKRTGDIAMQTDRASKRGRDEFGSDAVSHGPGNGDLTPEYGSNGVHKRIMGARPLVAMSEKSRANQQKQVDCPVFKHHIMHNTSPPCRGCRVAVMSQVRSHLNPTRASIHGGFPSFVHQCSRCKQDFVKWEAYDDHASTSSCLPQNATRGEITIPWARLYLALYPDALQIPLPWLDERGWLPGSVLDRCRELELQTNSQKSDTRLSPQHLQNGPPYMHAMGHMLHNIVNPTYITSLGPSVTLESNQIATHQGPDNNTYWQNVLRTFRTHQRTMRETAAHLTNDQLQHLAAQSELIFKISRNFANESQAPEIYDNKVNLERNLTTQDFQTRLFNEDIHSLVDSKSMSVSNEPSAKARDSSVPTHLPSDSGYQSGAGTDTESIISEVSTGRSLGVSGHFIHDFVAFFGDTLIQKAGAQQWSEYAMAHNSPAAIEKRLAALLKAFTIHISARSTPMTPEDSTDHPPQDDPSTLVLLDGAIKLIRVYRPMIARYFLDNSVSSEGNSVSLSDHLQGLGRHFSLAERVNLLSHQEVHEIDAEDEDNIVDEYIMAQLEPVQAMLVSGDAFRHLASELRQSLYRDDMYQMTTIRNVVLQSMSSSNTVTACWATATFSAKWDVMGFMRSQYSRIPSVASVVVLIGSALYAQATTCGEYVRTNWPLIGSIFLDLLDKVLAPDAENTATIKPELKDSSPSIRICLEDDCVSLSADAATKGVIVEMAQVLAWIGSAFSNSPFGEDLAYRVPSVARTRNAGALSDSESFTKVGFDISFEHEPLHETETACWLPLFNGMTIVTGFPIPSRGEEIGLEISLELLAAIAGVSHVTKFQDGLVMKAFSSLILPVQKTEDRVQWHAITSQDSDTYLSYHDGLSRCKSRLSSRELRFDDLKSTRTFLGWCSIYTSRLGSRAVDYENIDYSGAGEAGASIYLNGAQVGFQQWATATANLSIGDKQTKHYIVRDGPFRTTISVAERTPVLLYDTYERRGYLVTAADVMLHIIQHRHRLDPYEIHNQRVVLETCIPTGATARETLRKNQNKSLSDDGSFTFKNVIHNIWSILEGLRAETVSKSQDARGVAIKNPFSQHLHGYEFKAVVQERGDYTLMEQTLSGDHGGWPQLVRDINALVLFADGFGDLLLPSNENKSQLCNVWQRVPSGCDYIATTCNVLTDLYDVAGNRTSRKHLTTTHLQWHQGESQLFDSCGNTKSCTCNRLQQIVSKSDVVVRPSISDVEAGAIIFGNSDSLLQNIATSIRLKVALDAPFYHHANAALAPPGDCLPEETSSKVGAYKSESNATTIVLSPGVETPTKHLAPDMLPKKLAPEVAHRPMPPSKKRHMLPDSACVEFDQDRPEYERCENTPLLKRKQAFRIGSAG